MIELERVAELLLRHAEFLRRVLMAWMGVAAVGCHPGLRRLDVLGRNLQANGFKYAAKLSDGIGEQRAILEVDDSGFGHLPTHRHHVLEGGQILSDQSPAHITLIEARRSALAQMHALNAAKRRDHLVHTPVRHDGGSFRKRLEHGAQIAADEVVYGLEQPLASGKLGRLELQQLEPEFQLAVGAGLILRSHPGVIARNIELAGIHVAQEAAVPQDEILLVKFRVVRMHGCVLGHCPCPGGHFLVTQLNTLRRLAAGFVRERHGRVQLPEICRSQLRGACEQALSERTAAARMHHDDARHFDLLVEYTRMAIEIVDQSQPIGKHVDDASYRPNLIGWKSGLMIDERDELPERVEEPRIAEILEARQSLGALQQILHVEPMSRLGVGFSHNMGFHLCSPIYRSETYFRSTTPARARAWESVQRYPYAAVGRALAQPQDRQRIDSTPRAAHSFRWFGWRDRYNSMKFWQSLQFAATLDLPELARTIERDTPFHGVFLGDHTVYPERLLTPYPYTPDGKVLWAAEMDWPDIGAALGAMGAITRRLRFVTGVYILPLRHPVDVAKMMATVSILSDARVALGIGVGWMEDEFRAAGIDFKTRGKRCDEMIEVMRRLWEGRMVEYHGRYFDFPPSQLSPAPKSRIPIYVGGDSPAALRRAALMADGWISSGLSPDTILGSAQTVRTLLAEAGRPTEGFEFVASVRPDLEFIKRLRDGGMTSIFNLATPEEIAGRVSAQEKLANVRRYADEVIAKV
jgi:probable F420-dependent oxidoreductase